MTEQQPDWEERYAQPGYFCGTEPAQFLRGHLQELPRGAVLDLAIGEGRNALFLARHGYRVYGVDQSTVGLAKAQARVRQLGLHAYLWAADLERYPLPEAQFEVVVCFYYLQRSLFPQMERALRQGGALIMETYTIEQLPCRHGPSNPEHLLQPNELYRAFRHLRVVHYREMIKEERATASLLAFRG